MFKHTFCIIPCGKSKIWDKHPEVGPTPARFVYVGPFASMCRRYAEKFYPGDWAILSAKHGFLLPEDWVPENYNTCFNKPSDSLVSNQKLKSQRPHLGTDIDCIVVLGGSVYIERVKVVFANIPIRTPLSGVKGIGRMMSTMKNAIISECAL